MNGQIKKYDIIIIGAGPGGYTAAIRASQFGKKVALFEKEHLGGTCLNWGCIPTKALLANAEVISNLSAGDKWGFSIAENSIQLDYGKAQARSREVSAKLCKGIEHLMQKNKIEVIRGNAEFISEHSIRCDSTEYIYEAKDIIIATGASPLVWNNIPIENENILTSRNALELTELPDKIIIVGGGAIGLEFATIWNAYGVKVIVIEMMDRILPQEDKEISTFVQKQYEKNGIEIFTNTRVEAVSGKGKRLIVTVKNETKTLELHAGKVLLSTGIKPNTENLGLEKAKIETINGFISTDDSMCTSTSGVYAIGDITGKLALAHVATAQGFQAVDNIVGNEIKAIEYGKLPKCTYGNPETASCGLTEAQGVEKGFEVKTATFPLAANGKALSINHSDGLMKIVSDSKTGEILGFHLCGPHVTEIISGCVGYLNLEMTVNELSKIVHPHPSLSECLVEAAHILEGKPIHI